MLQDSRCTRWQILRRGGVQRMKEILTLITLITNSVERNSTIVPASHYMIYVVEDRPRGSTHVFTRKVIVPDRWEH